MQILARSFAKGLLVVLPISLTAWVIWFGVSSIDTLLNRILKTGIPGVGLLVTLVGITFIGFVATNAIGRRVFSWVEDGLSRLPVVKLVYGSLKDLLSAFVGDRKSFDQPAVVTLKEGVRVLGFVTCERFDDPQLNGYVSVYLPQSYNFAGNLIVVRHEQVKKLDADGAQFMAFIVSGGVAEMSGARTVYDGGLKLPR